VNKDESLATYPYNSYFRRHELIKYFDKEHWELINHIERFKLRPLPPNQPIESKEHYIGYIQIRKKTHNEYEIPHTYKFNIKLGRKQ